MGATWQCIGSAFTNCEHHSLITLILNERNSYKKPVHQLYSSSQQAHKSYRKIHARKPPKSNHTHTHTRASSLLPRASFINFPAALHQQPTRSPIPILRTTRFPSCNFHSPLARTFIRTICNDLNNSLPPLQLLSSAQHIARQRKGFLNNPRRCPIRATPLCVYGRRERHKMRSALR